MRRAALDSVELEVTFAQEARTFHALMRHLALERVHVVGHSASACIALQYPEGMAEGLAAFVARHSFGVAA